MKTSSTDPVRQSQHLAKALLEQSIVALFDELPALCGFSVQDRAGLPDGAATPLERGLFLTDIGLYPQPALEESRLICEEIREALMQLIDERPDARALLSGRTFARHLQ